MSEYRLTGIDDDLWRKAKARATYEGRSLRFVLLALLRVYVKHGFTVVETFDGERKE